MKNSTRTLPIKILALGDSYTIGEAVPETERFAHQTMQWLQRRHPAYTFAPIRYIATTGWTTEELNDAIVKENIQDTFGLVTLLIGVNDQYRGYPIEKYGTRFELLLRRAIAFAGGNARKVQVLTIPDYGVTPFAAGRNPARIAQEIDAYNTIASDISRKLKVQVTNITPLSRMADPEQVLVAPDGLHPSGLQYRQWAALLGPAIKL